MTRISSGGYWKDFFSQQRKDLLNLYMDWSTASYAARFDEYSGQYFQITGAQIADRRADVQSDLIKKNGEPVHFLYKLIQTGVEWRIVDIHVKGVSQLANTRAQFISIKDTRG